MEFFQVPPKLANQYSDDRTLVQYLKNIFPNNFYPEIEKELMTLGQKVVDVMEPLAQEAEANEPVHVPYSPWGKRIDHIKVSPAWEELHKIAATEGIVASGYERKYQEYSRVFQFAKLYLYHPSSAIYSCPLAMTDGAARVIELYGSPYMKEKVYLHLISRDPKSFWTSGQWMTERTGGSDVSGTSTIARKDGDQYRLHGVKWFTSATTSEMAMTLAYIEGEKKLSLFYVELRDKEGNLQNIQINRLKDKLGTKALPTAELTLSGTPATLIGENGKGVRTIATLFNITRLYNACCAVGYMRRGIALAKDYSTKRVAFGKPIIEHGLHLETLTDMQVRFEASFLFTFHAVHLLGKEELAKATETESATLRLLIPLVKLFTAKEGVAVISEVLEAFGGAGYVEDTGLPQLLRNAQVLAIWEGTTNVLSLDALRAIRKENAGEHFIKELSERLNGLKHPDLFPMRDLVIAAVQNIKQVFKEALNISEEDLNSSARELALGLSRTYIAALMLENAEKTMARENDQRDILAAQRWIEKGLFNVSLSTVMRRTDSRQILG